MKVAVLLSGGVDSSTTTYILKQLGINLTAFYIKIWMPDSFNDCPWKEDLDYVHKVTKQLNVPLEVISLQKEYWDNVMKYMLSELKKGLTPNPDVVCNTLIKFGIFNTKYGKDFDYIATGHYACRFSDVLGLYDRYSSVSTAVYIPTKIISSLKYPCLVAGVDPIKDQSYFLSRLTPKEVSKALFPLGLMYKKDVRKLAACQKLASANRKDSQGLCFIGNIDFRKFIGNYTKKQEGDIIDIETNQVVGRHNGLPLFTIGQRSGLNIGGLKVPYYVVKKDTKRNVLYVASGKDNPYLWKDLVTLHDVDVFVPSLFSYDISYDIKLRYQQTPIKGKILKKNDTVVQLKLDKKAFAVTPGQFGVLYHKNIVIASGVIA